MAAIRGAREKYGTDSKTQYQKGTEVAQFPSLNKKSVVRIIPYDIRLLSQYDTSQSINQKRSRSKSYGQIASNLKNEKSKVTKAKLNDHSAN